VARRLVEQGVSFVEVSLGDNGRWDTHSSNFETVRELSGELDAGWSASTTISKRAGSWKRRRSCGW